MAVSTNPLIAGTKRYIFPAIVSASVAFGALAVESHMTGVHAAAGLGAGTAAAPLDPGSIAPLTSLDTAMEALSSRVEPSVVNIAVTSTPSAEETRPGRLARWRPRRRRPGAARTPPGAAAVLWLRGRPGAGPHATAAT